LGRSLDLWYKNAVENFMDPNGHGISDFGGLADRLDHIEALGATCIWLLPFTDPDLVAGMHGRRTSGFQKQHCGSASVLPWDLPVGPAQFVFLPPTC
jgi:hypothetical protein